MPKKEKAYSHEQLLRKAKRMRALMSIAPSMRVNPKKRVGIELFLATGEGKIRVLAYNMANSERLPLFINIHGSGFTIGSAEMDDPHMLNIAEKAGVKILSVDYSLAPEYPFPKALNECYAVLKYAKEHPDELGIDPERIAVGGQSAGGNFTAAICLMECERNQLGLKCAILDYPPLDVYTDASEKPHPKGALPVFLSRIFDPCYLNDKEARKNPLVSPVFADLETLRRFPPTLIITASRDSLCQEGEKFRDMLVSAGVDVTHKRFEAVHGFNLKRRPAANESWQMIIDQLKLYI